MTVLRREGRSLESCIEKTSASLRKAASRLLGVVLASSTPTSFTRLRGFPLSDRQRRPQEADETQKPHEQGRWDEPHERRHASPPVRAGIRTGDSSNLTDRSRNAFAVTAIDDAVILLTIVF